MEKLISSVDYISQLRKGDIIYQSETNENYLVAEVGDGFLLLTDCNEPRALKIIYFPDLIAAKWQIKSVF